MTGWAAADGNRSDPRHYPDAIKTFEEHESDEAACEEISQLLYHAQVMMIAKGYTLADVYERL